MNNEQKILKVGDRVKIVALPTYIKTAEPMPMLRPPNLLSIGEEGVIMERRLGGYWGIRFTQGAFLLESQYITVISD
ncbi:MAG: regulatory protein SipA [Waterburya sp.]